ncbi:hypothetical protein [Thalassospira lucentensis]|uniref:hypothetical protein n=1 Tax=Thalassospira lucentensis TaxID=168935 RepID=UPI003AA81641
MADDLVLLAETPKLGGQGREIRLNELQNAKAFSNENGSLSKVIARCLKLDFRTLFALCYRNFTILGALARDIEKPFSKNVLG